MSEMLLVIMLAGRRAALPAVQVNAVIDKTATSSAPIPENTLRRLLCVHRSDRAGHQ